MTIQERAEVAVVSKIDSALSYLQEELEDGGVTNLNLPGMAAVFAQEVREFYKDKVQDDSPVDLMFGLQDQSQPNALARSIMCAHIRRWLDDVLKAIRKIEEREDDKILSWVEKNTGKKCQIDLKALVAVESDPNEQVVGFLSAAFQVMNYEPEHLQQIISCAPAATDGVIAFIRDLAAARFSDPRVESVLNDLLDVKSPDVIDDVMEHQEIMEHKEFKAIHCLGQMLKKAIEADIKDEDWKTMHDDDDEGKSEDEEAA